MKLCQDKPIFTSLSPNTEKDDILLALKLLLQPWKWTNDKKQAIVENPSWMLENKFKEYLSVKHAFAFNSGRAAFMAILNALELEQGREVLLQAFTCNAVVNPIIWQGLKPVFVDIDEKTLNIDTSDLEKKISGKSRAVVIQHTFGLPAFAKAASFADPRSAEGSDETRVATKAESAGKPADTSADTSESNKILEICQKHNLILIEDCAHSLGAKYNGKFVGTFGKAAFFSFGRDKVISSVSGGMATTDDDQLAQKLKEFQQSLSYPSSFWIFRELLHPLLTNFLIIPLYGFYGLGKWALIFLLKTGILSKSVRDEEKNGKMPAGSQKRMSEPLAILALNQFKKLDKFLEHQRQIASFYEENIKTLNFLLPPSVPGRIYMRYPFLAKNLEIDKILKEARRKKIFLDDGWRKTVITPPDTNQEKMGYRAGDCPVAEKVAETIINLPTHINISKNDAQRIVCFIKSMLK